MRGQCKSFKVCGGNSKLHVLDCGLHISPKKRVKGSTLSQATWTIFNMGSPVSGTNIKIHLQELKLILIFAFCACIILTVSQKVLKLRLVEYRGHCIYVVCLLVCFVFLFWFVGFFFFCLSFIEVTESSLHCLNNTGKDQSQEWSVGGRWGYRIQKVGRLLYDISAAASPRLRDETSERSSTNESLVPNI